MKKTLFLNLTNWPWHLENELEIMKNLMDAGNQVYSLACSGKFMCCTTHSLNPKACYRCREKIKLGLDLIQLPKTHRLRLQPVKYPKFPKFNNISELRSFTMDGINLGFGPANTLIFRTEDADPSFKKYRFEVEEYLKFSYSVKCNVERLIKDLKIDSVYMFNGRFTEYYSVLELCKKLHVDFYILERGSNKNLYTLLKNDLLHRRKRYMETAWDCWNKCKDTKERDRIAQSFFENSRKRIESLWYSYTKDQHINELPKDFDPKKENISIFNSSLFEYALFDDFKNPIDASENTIIESIFKRYQNDKSKHFYLRVHPHLKGNTSQQMQEIRALVGKYKNVTIILPEDSIDTYSLLDASSKIITFGSTVGVEATYWGKPSICAGTGIYEGSGCMYHAANYKELFDLIDKKDLKPKEKETTYLVGYYLTQYGLPFKYFKATSFYDGTFLNVDIQKKVKKIPLIKKPFLKLKKIHVQLKKAIRRLKKC